MLIRLEVNLDKEHILDKVYRIGKVWNKKINPADAAASPGKGLH